MINNVHLKNFGPLAEIDWQNLGPINLVIGNSGCGKTFLLKALYSALRTIEDYKRGNNPESFYEIWKKKLFWTFQMQTDEMVTKNSDDQLYFDLCLNDRKISYQFLKSWEGGVTFGKGSEFSRAENSIFFPAKEVLSIYKSILLSRNTARLFDFDDTYFDLVQALLISPPDDLLLAAEREFFTETTAPEKGAGSWDFQVATSRLNGLMGGGLIFDSSDWYFEEQSFDKKSKYPIRIAAEGIRKVAALDRLLRNGYLTENSIVFIDEPESNLHPEAISDFLDVIAILAKHGIQFFIASHSYFVVKKLFLIAQQQKLSIPVLSYENESWSHSNLLHDFPDNPIIDESTRLFKEEVNLPT